MLIDVEKAARFWAAQNPEVVGYTNRLEELGAHPAIFSGVLREMLAPELGMTRYASTQDIDILLPADDFALAAMHLPSVEVRLRQRFQFISRDSHRVTFHADEISGQIGGREVQILRPRTLVNSSGHWYDTRFTPQAVRARTLIQTDYGMLPLAHPAETFGIYGIVRRSQGKNDLLNAAMLASAANPFADTYTYDRAQEMRWDQPVWNFIYYAVDSSAVILAQHAERSEERCKLPLTIV